MDNQFEIIIVEVDVPGCLLEIECAYVELSIDAPEIEIEVN